MKLKRSALLGVAILVPSLSILLALRTPSEAPRQDPPAQPTLAGKDMCLICHEDQNNIALTPHAPQECESCHGLGSVHAESGGVEPIPVRGVHAGATTEQCQTCHGDDRSIGAFRMTAHARDQLSCASCHKVHSSEARSGLLKVSEAKLCTDCHQAAKAEFRRPYHHPVLEGGMECSSCHDPHDDEAESRMGRIALGGEESCVGCHADKRGPFAFEHAPLQIDNCQSCHQPHGSINPRMLKRTQQHLLCLECHSRTPMVATSQPPSFHDIRSPRFRNCTTCHREIHGSNASPLFLR